MSLTKAIARPEHRDLRHSALLGILAVALSMVGLAVIGESVLRLSAAYVGKAVAVFSCGAVLVLLGLPAHHPFRAIGPANQVTVVRGALVALLAALIGERADTGAMALATLLACAATILDGFDGWFARRTHMASAFGARFDMETDALLIVALAVLAWQFGKVGAWVLLSGLLRYLWLAARAILPRLRRPVPASYRGKTIAVVQMIALIIAIMPFSSRQLSVAVAALALIALTCSFLLDLVWLLRSR